MRKFLFLIPFFLFACKKEDKSSRISLRQQPSKIAVFTVDTATGIQTLQYEINYFYNDSTARFDSISVGGMMYRFNYAVLSAQHKVLLNYTNDSTAHGEIIFSTDFYTLNNYNEIPTTGTVVTHALQYDTYKRITYLQYNNYPSNANYTQSYSYNIDTIFIQTNRPYDACTTHDTVLNTYVNMSNTLPYLLFTNLLNNCGTLGLNVLRALPVSNYINKFPYKIRNETFETTFVYTGDSDARLVKADITTRLKSNNTLFQKTRILVTY